VTNSVADATSFNPWNQNASYWTKIIREKRDKYRNELTDAALLQAIGQCEGLRVLDAGCGEGYMSRKLANLGAQVTGVDASEGLIAAARSYPSSQQATISFEVASVDSLPYADRAFDLVLCNHLINDLPDPSGPIREFARLLRPAGRIVILMLHPCFYNKHIERTSAANGMGAPAYFQARSIDQHFEVDGLTSPVANTAWLRPLEFYTEELRKSGFSISSLTEPHPTPEQLGSDPWWRASFTRPLFMLIAADLS
jgi:2-polyprenyl-3-methyl-5-hydroxy-6-metoxy-1,4-benzoquinol methylase